MKAAIYQKLAEAIHALIPAILDEERAKARRALSERFTHTALAAVLADRLKIGADITDEDLVDAMMIGLKAATVFAGTHDKLDADEAIPDGAPDPTDAASDPDPSTPATPHPES